MAATKQDPPPFTILAQFQNSFDGFFWETGHWFSVDTEDMPSYEQLLLFAGDIGGAWNDDVNVFLNELNEFIGVQCVIWGNPPEALDFFTGVPGTGGASGDSEAAQVAAVVSWPIARHHKGGHPRNYIGGLGDGDLATVATLTSAFASDLQAGYTTFQSDVNSTTLGDSSVQLGVVSFRNNKVWRDDPVFFPYLGAPTVRLPLGTQRRRLKN